MSAGRALERGVSDTQERTYAVEQAAERADDDDFNQDILPNCSDEELKSVFYRLVSRGL
jgi:hypothetical protein